MRGNTDAALALIDESIGMWTRIDRFSLERARAVNNRGVIRHRVLKDLAGAEQDYQEALQAMAALGGQLDLSIATGLANLGDVQRELGRNAEAQASYARALAIREARLGADHPQTQRVRADLELVQAAPTGQ